MTTKLARDQVLASEFDTIILMTASAENRVGQVVKTKEATTGNGGGRTYDVVLTSAVTPDGDLIIIGVEDASISFVVREKDWPLLYDGSNAAVEMRAGARGALVRSTTLNQATAFNAVPSGVPTGLNKAYSNIRAWDVDIETSPTGSRRAIGQETHYDTDATMRVRHSTRSEGTPTLKHTDYYWQINGNNCMYVGSALGGVGASAISMGWFPQPMAFKVDFATATGTSTGVTNYWAADTVYAVGDQVALSDNDFVYLEVTAIAGDFKSDPTTEPTPTAIGTTGLVDDQVTWKVESRLMNSAKTLEAIPVMWMAESGNTGFGTMQPTFSFDFADTTNFQKINRYSSSAGVAAAGVSSLDNSTLLTTEINEVSTVAANAGVRLPTAAAGKKVSIVNNGANTLLVWPFSGDDLGAGTNTNTTLAVGVGIDFHCYGSNNWYSV